MIVCKRPSVAAGTQAHRAHSRQKPNSTANAKEGSCMQIRPYEHEPTKATLRSACLEEFEIYSLD